MRTFIKFILVLFIFISIVTSAYAELKIDSLTQIQGLVEGSIYVGIIGEDFTKDTVFRFDYERVFFKRFVNSTTVYILTVKHNAVVVDIIAINDSGTFVFSSAFEFKNEAPVLNRLSNKTGLANW